MSKSLNRVLCISSFMAFSETKFDKGDRGILAPIRFLKRIKFRRNVTKVIQETRMSVGHLKFKGTITILLRLGHLKNFLL